MKLSVDCPDRPGVKRGAEEMNRETRALKVVVGSLFAVCAVAVGLSVWPARAMASDLSGAPEWVVKGCTAFTDGKSDRICSVASVEGSNKLSQCRSNAQNQGRADIARQFEVLVRAMFSGYQTADDATAPDDKKVIDAAIRATQQKISDLRVEENWFSLDGRCFVLMVLDLAGFESTVQKINQGRDARNQVNKNADKAFDELDRRTAE